MLPTDPRERPLISGAAVSMDELLNQIRSGGPIAREAAATFLSLHSGCIRRRIRSRLCLRTSAAVDHQDVFATVCRRLDRYILAGKLNIHNEASLWSLVYRIVDSALTDNIRSAARARSCRPLARPDGNTVAPLRPSQTIDEQDLAHHLLTHAHDSIMDDTDRNILMLWLSGHNHRRISGQLGLSWEAVRIRWHRICLKLRSQAATRTPDPLPPPLAP